MNIYKIETYASVAAQVCYLFFLRLVYSSLFGLGCSGFGGPCSEFEEFCSVPVLQPDTMITDITRIAEKILMALYFIGFIIADFKLEDSVFPSTKETEIVCLPLVLNSKIPILYC